MAVSGRLRVANCLCFEGDVEQKRHVVVRSHKVKEELDVLGNVGDGLVIDPEVWMMCQQVE